MSAPALSPKLIRQEIEAGASALHAETGAKGVTAIQDVILGGECNDLMDTMKQIERPDVAAVSIGVVATYLQQQGGIEVGNLRSPTNRQATREVARAAIGHSEGIELSVVLGGSEQPMSTRAPAYIMPLLATGELMQRAEIPVSMRIVSAAEVSASLNGLNPYEVRKRARQGERFLTAFTERFFPDIAPNVHFEQLSVEELRAKGLDDDTEYLLTEMNDDESQIGGVLRKLASRIERAGHMQGDRSVSETVAGYAASHGLAFRNYRYDQVTSTFKFGGSGEKPFNQVQQHMTERALANGEHVVNKTREGGVQLVNLQTKAGTIPPYYPLPGEVTLDSPASSAIDFGYGMNFAIGEHPHPSFEEEYAMLDSLGASILPAHYSMFVREQLGSEAGIRGAFDVV